MTSKFAEGDTLSSQELGYDKDPIRVEFNESDATAIWTEDLYFHRMTVGSIKVDAIVHDVAKNPGAGSKIAKWINEHYKGAIGKGKTVSASLVSLEEKDALEFSIQVPLDESSTIESISDYINGFVSSLYNITDPGTFGHLYVFRQEL